MSICVAIHIAAHNCAIQLMDDTMFFSASIVHFCIFAIVSMVPY